MLQMFFISQAVQCQVKLPVDQTAFKGEIEILNCCRKLIIYSRYLYAFHRKGLIVLFSFRNFLKINIAGTTESAFNICTDYTCPVTLVP